MSTSPANDVDPDLRDRIRRFDGRVLRNRTVLPSACRRSIKAARRRASPGEPMCSGGSVAVEAAGAMRFAAGIAARIKGRVLRCLTRPDLVAPALA